MALRFLLAALHCVERRWGIWARLDRNQSFRCQYRAVPAQVYGRVLIAPRRV